MTPELAPEKERAKKVALMYHYSILKSPKQWDNDLMTSVNYFLALFVGNEGSNMINETLLFVHLPWFFSGLKRALNSPRCGLFSTILPENRLPFAKSQFFAQFLMNWTPDAFMRKKCAKSSTVLQMTVAFSNYIWVYFLLRTCDKHINDAISRQRDVGLINHTSHRGKETNCLIFATNSLTQQWREKMLPHSDTDPPQVALLQNWDSKHANWITSHKFQLDQSCLSFETESLCSASNLTKR